MTGSVVLSASADYRQTSERTWVREAPYSDWTAVDAYTITNWVKITPYTQDYERENYVQNCGLQIGVSGGYELEYYVTLQYGSDTISEGNWKSTKELQYVGYDWDNHGNTGNAYVNYYVRRVDGQPLSKSDIENTVLFVNGYSVEYVQESAGTTAIPPEWFDNTTQTYETVTTVSVPAEYDDLVGTIPSLDSDIGGTPPSWFEQYNPINYPWFIDVLVSFQDWFDMVTLVAGQMKIFWVFGGFVIVGLLLAWLLH